jgi:hypothetical protein
MQGPGEVVELRNNQSFGILCRNSQEWAEIVTSVDENTLLSLISRKDGKGSTVSSDDWKT